MKAFWSLSTERQLGMAVGPIPHSKITEYGSRKQLTPGMMGLFEYAVRSLDRAYMKWVSDQKPSKE